MRGAGNRVLASLLALAQILAHSPAVLHGQDGGSGILPAALAAETSGARILAAEGGSVALGTTDIWIPAGALSRDTEIRITRLPATEPTGEGLENATAGGGGYRFEPAGTVFLKPVTIRMAYAPELNGDGQALGELYTYYYDTRERAWTRLERVGIEAELNRVVSETTHFTDMINGTLALPEGPKPLSFNINSIKGLEAADPSAGVPGIEGLEGGSGGAAGFRIALEVLPGRRGMQPSVAVAYSSDGQNGAMGKGFDLQASGRVSTDTRWGLPAYAGGDSYLLDGVTLEKDGGRSTAAAHRYASLRNSGFEEITRHVGGGEDYWGVRDKRGTRRTYGRRDDSWGGDGPGRKYTWELEEERDTHGNTVSYYYEKNYNEVYLTRIAYTGINGAGGAYAVALDYKGGRRDIRVDGRGKYARETRLLLAGVRMEYLGATVRGYEMEYRENMFGASQLAALRQTDRAGRTVWEYRFEYQGHAGAVFADAAEWAGTGHGVRVSQGSSSGADGSIAGGAGIGSRDEDLHVSKGRTTGGSRGDSEVLEMLVDLDGDGRPDSVWVENGKVYYAPNQMGRFGSAREWPNSYLGIESLEDEATTNESYGSNRFAG
jgi:hypothetical protein